jgi:beta-glucosidase
LYEFGFGLSYTIFELSDLIITTLGIGNISSTPSATNTTSPGGNPDLWSSLFKVTATVSNTGSVYGAAVPQLYISIPSTIGDGSPIQQLRGFDKLTLQPGEQKTVEFELARRDISVWDTVLQEWRVPRGEFDVKVGFSSRDARVSGSFNV